MTQRRILLISFALGVALLPACASGYSASHPLYDFDTVYLNSDMSGQQPWKAANPKALRAALDKEASAEGQARARGLKKRTQHRLEPTRNLSGRSAAKSPRALANHIPAHMAAIAQSDYDDTRSPSRLQGLILGDGSTRGEVSAAASRLVGMGPAITPMSFVQHLEKAAAFKLPRRRGPGGGIASIWRALEAKGATFQPGEATPLAGDLVFFHHVADVDGDGRSDVLSGIGVVARAPEGDTLLCFAPVKKAVRLIFLTPERADIRKKGGETFNTPIRRRHRDEEQDVPRLSGQLLVGFARI